MEFFLKKYIHRQISFYDLYCSQTPDANPDVLVSCFQSSHIIFVKTPPCVYKHTWGVFTKNPTDETNCSFLNLQQ